MSKSNTFENDLLALIFNGTAIANLADNASLLPLTELHLALHTASPGEDGTQSTSETAYTGYARRTLTRDGFGWVVTGNSVSPATNVEFGECTGFPGAAITHVSVGTAASGVGKVLYYGALTPSITMAAGVIPRLTTASTITEE